jgi:hypothetical protein
MRLSSLLLAVVAAAVLLESAPAGADSTPAPSSQGAYKAYASCDDAEPFHSAPAHRCGYDKPRLFRATFVFRSEDGKRALKACFRVYGAAPLGGGHACAKLKPTAYKAYPFKISGVRQPFSVKVTWFTKAPGAGGRFKPVATSFLRAHT